MRQNKCKITFRLKFGNVNGYMKAIFINNAQELNAVVNEDDTSIVICDVILPSTIIIVASDKQANDTLVDENNNIIQDKFIEITDISINQLPLNDTFLYHRIYLKDDMDKIINTGNYIGQNGTITLDLNEDTVMKQVIVCNNKLLDGEK